MKRRVGALLMALVLVMTGFAAYAEEGQPAELAVEDSVEYASVPEEEPVEGEDAAYEEEPAAPAEETAAAAEPEAAPETTQVVEAEPEEQTTVPEETQSEAATEPETTALAEETEEDIESYTAQKGSLSVTVEAPKGALPDGVQLDMQLVDADSEEYEEVQSYVQEGKEEEEKEEEKEEESNLEVADIYFTLDGEKVDPSEAVTVKLGLTEFTDADRSTLQAWDYTDRMQGTFNADTQEVEFITANLQTFAATWEDDQGFSEDTDLDGNDEQETEVNNENEDYFSGLSLEVSHRIANEDDADEDNESYQAGMEIVFEIVVTNNGEFPISDIEVTNNLTEASEPIAYLEAGGDSDTREVYYTITENDENEGYVEIDVTATGHYTDDTDPDNPEEVTVEISASDVIYFYGIMTLSGGTNPELTVTMEVSEDTPPKDGQAYREGEKIIYEIKVTNTGEEDLRDIALEDLLTSDFSEEIRFLRKGYYRTFSLSYLVTEDDVGNGSVINMATATVDGMPFNSEEVEVFTEIGPRLSVDYEITSTPKNGEAYQEGEPITYTITVTNTGDVELSNIKVTDELTQKSFKIPTLQPGESKTFDLEYVIQGEDANSLSPELFSKADVEGEYVYEDSDKSEKINAEDIDSVELKDVPVEPRPQKFVDVDEKDHDFKDANKEVEVGQTLTYQITYKNANTKAKTVTITDQLPDSLEYVSDSATGSGNYNNGTITWTIDDVQPNDGGSVTFSAKVTENSTGGVSNSASVKIGNKKTQTYEVYNPRKDDSPQSPTKSVSAGNSTVSIGDELTYTIKYYNHHNDVETVTITDELDDGLTYLNNTVSNGGEYDSGTITWEVEAAPFTWGEVSFKATVNKNAGTTVEDDYFDEEEEKDDEDGDEEDSFSITAYSETVTTGSVSNYALVTIGDDEEKVTNVVTNNLYSTSGGSGSGSGSGGEGSGENKAVNTADDTPVAPMAVLFGTALIVLGADILYRRRRTQR